jgi:hypothetical protein
MIATVFEYFGQFTGDESPLDEIKQDILDRLKSGDRLMAITAGGVSWQRSPITYYSGYEFPNWTALDALLEEGKIVRVNSSVPMGTAVVSVCEITLAEWKHHWGLS